MLFQPLSPLPVIRNILFYQLPKFPGMVHMPQVGQFMNHYVVHNLLGHIGQFVVKIQILPAAAASPPGFLVFYSNTPAVQLHKTFIITDSFHKFIQYFLLFLLCGQRTGSETAFFCRLFFCLIGPADPFFVFLDKFFQTFISKIHRNPGLDLQIPLYLQPQGLPIRPDYLNSDLLLPIGYIHHRNHGCSSTING